MKIGIYSKFKMSGGSEFRCIELARGIAEYTGYSPIVFTEEAQVPEEIAARAGDAINGFSIPIVYDCFTHNLATLNAMDILLVVNSDSKEFTQFDYWKQRNVDVKGFRRMVFLFNFIVSPARYLCQFEPFTDVRIITTNHRFFRELGEKDKHRGVAHFPRTVLESPIDPATVTTDKTPSNVIRIGKHSKGVGNKWNDDHRVLIHSVNKDYQHAVAWDFMGCNSEIAETLEDIPNVTLRKEFSLSVKDYLQGIDIFLFFIDYKRQEPWARVVGEAMSAGCPILAPDTDGGIQNQIIQGSNGFLCKSVDDMYQRIVNYIENPRLAVIHGGNSALYAREFHTERVIDRLMRFIL